jgi:hypothetical protein
MPGGRPSPYKKEYNEQVIKLCRLGATDKEIADFFNVCEATVNNWKHNYPQFLESIKSGKAESDMNVANSLYNRACGYKHEEEKNIIVYGEKKKIKESKYFPPDPTAMIFWLKNRRSKDWRDKQDLVHSGDININVTLDEE